MQAAGAEGPGRSPDRADAMVWAMTELFRPERAVRVRMLLAGRGGSPSLRPGGGRCSRAGSRVRFPCEPNAIMPHPIENLFQ